MAVDINSFIAAFPNAPFASLDPVDIINMIDQVAIETCSHEQLPTEAQQDQALNLHVAHLLTLQISTNTAAANGGKVKSYKSKHDQIVYAVNEDDPFDLAQTVYGQRLQGLLDKVFVAFEADTTPTAIFPYIDCSSYIY